MTEETEQQPPLDEAMVAKMRQPLDASAEYHLIKTSTIIQLEQLFEEVPGKYYKLLLPCLKAGIEPLPPAEPSGE